MSQVRTRPNLTELTAVSLGSESVRSMSSVTNSALANITDASIRELFTGSIELKSTTMKSVNSNTIESPVRLRHSFAESFTKSLNDSAKSLDSLAKQKIAAIKTINSTNYKIQNSSVIEKGIIEIANATDAKSFTKAVETTMNVVQEQHSTLFSQSVANVVKQASVTVGFTNVKVLNTGSKVSIIAQNEQGQAILTEVRIDNSSSRIDLVSETIGIKDNSCDALLNKFDKELEKSGLKHKEAQVKWTGGNTFLPTSKEVERNLSKSKSKEQNDRIKKATIQNHLNS